MKGKQYHSITAPYDYHFCQTTELIEANTKANVLQDSSWISHEKVFTPVVF